jgi:hypothetical protein
MKQMLVWSGMFLFAASCFPQKNEVNVVSGNTWSYNSNATVTGLAPTPFTFGSGRASNLTYEVGVARQLASFRPASLSLELTATGIPAPASSDFTSVFVVPSAKFTFLPRNRISPFASTGVGVVHLAKDGFPSRNAVAYQFGGGVDVKTPVRFLSFRAEGRDFLASQSGTILFRVPDPGVTVKESFRNHVLAGGGLVVRF